ncbi:MAG TPA: hypothetical protein VGF61_17865 [Candidatus Acidoferrum sp.]
MSVHTLFELGVRLVPMIVKAGLAICGIGSQGGSGAPVALNLCSSLLAFCPASRICSCAMAFFVSCLHSAVLQQVLAVIMPL